MAQLAVNKMTMVNVMKGLMIFTLALCAAVVFGCGTMQTRSESKIVPITTFTQVAGKWEGLSKRMPDMRDHAQVVMIINENGHFNFISDRRVGVILRDRHAHDDERTSLGNQWQWDRHHDAS